MGWEGLMPFVPGACRQLEPREHGLLCCNVDATEKSCFGPCVPGKKEISHSKIVKLRLSHAQGQPLLVDQGSTGKITGQGK